MDANNIPHFQEHEEPHQATHRPMPEGPRPVIVMAAPVRDEAEDFARCFTRGAGYTLGAIGALGLVALGLHLAGVLPGSRE